LTFCNLSEAQPVATPAVHIKGFGSRLDFDKQEVREAAAELKAWVQAASPASIVFDGDPYASDSFTALVAELGFPPRELVAFKYDLQENIEQVKSSWGSGRVGSMRVILVPETSGEDTPAEWAKLGKIALEATGAAHVLCLGGGETVELEVEMNPSVTFDVWPVSRPGRNGTTQACAISGDNPNVNLHALK